MPFYELSYKLLNFCIQMAPVLLARTTATTIPGAPQFLREIWTRLYPSAPPPDYRVFQDRPLGSCTYEFTATVILVSGSDPEDPVYTFRSRITDRMTRAIHEAAFDAIVLLRTFDAKMERDPRYSLLPTLDFADGSVHFAAPPDSEDSPITNLLHYTSLLEYYLHETLLSYAILRNDVVTANMARASGIDTSLFDPPSPGYHPDGAPHFLGASRRSTLEGFQEMLNRNSPRNASPPPPPRGPVMRATTRTSRYLSRFTPVRPPSPPTTRLRTTAEPLSLSMAILQSPSPSPGRAEYEVQAETPGGTFLPEY